MTTIIVVVVASWALLAIASHRLGFDRYKTQPDNRSSSSTTRCNYFFSLRRRDGRLASKNSSFHEPQRTLTMSAHLLRRPRWHSAIAPGRLFFCPAGFIAIVAAIGPSKLRRKEWIALEMDQSIVKRGRERGDPFLLLLKLSNIMGTSSFDSLWFVALVGMQLQPLLLYGLCMKADRDDIGTYSPSNKIANQEKQKRNGFRNVNRMHD